MRVSFIVLICMLASTSVLGQATVIARVLDADRRTPLPYATVVLNGTSRGTITNSEGWFSLPLQGENDSLRISFIGYRTHVIAFTASLDGSHILLERAVHELGEAVIRPGEDLYARVVAASNWLRRTPEVKAKLFYGLETHSDGQPVEVLHSFYSATYKAAMLTKLDFKRGRIGIAPKGDRHFINFNTAQAFALMDIHENHGHFPVSPFSYASRKALKNDFQVELITAASEGEGVDHLRATPRDVSMGAFTMDLWLAPGAPVVRGLELSCTNCVKYPFVPLFDHGRIDSVDMRYRQSWSTSSPYIPQVMELEYTTAYSGPDYSENFRSHAILHAFDHGTPFIPTEFRWPPYLEEYRKIAWLPEDSIFWFRMTPPLPTERQLRDQAFIAQNDLRNNSWYDQLGLTYDLLRPVYKAWSKNDRIQLREITGPWSAVERQHRDPTKVNLHGQLYLELDTTGGTCHWYSAAVFELGRAVHMPPLEDWTEQFINTFHDLCELERIRMEARLNSRLTVEEIVSIKQDHDEALRRTLDSYMKRSNCGRNGSVVQEYHRMVQDQWRELHPSTQHDQLKDR